MRKICANLTIIMLLTLMAGTAGATLFPLDNTAYVIRGGGAASPTSQLSSINQSVDPWEFTDIGDPISGRINNLGFRVEGTEGLLYGWRIATSGLSAGLVTIDAAGALTFTAITGMPTSSVATSGSNSSNLNAGDVYGNYMYLTDSGGGGSGFQGNPNLYVIDLATKTLTNTYAITGETGNVNDFAYNPFDGYLYGGNQVTGKITRLDPADGTRIDLGEAILPLRSGNNRFGGAWFDPAGILYLYENTQGRIYDITGIGGTPAWDETYLQGVPATDVDAAAYAVPEPATMLLLGFGLIGLAGIGRKKFLKKQPKQC